MAQSPNATLFPFPGTQTRVAKLKRELQCYQVILGMESGRSDAGGQLGHQATLGPQAGHAGCFHSEKGQLSSVPNPITMSLWTEGAQTCILLDVGVMMFAKLFVHGQLPVDTTQPRKVKG